MAIRYTETLPRQRDYAELFDTTGWNEMYRTSAEDLMEALRRSWYVVSAYDGDRLVGVGRILSDGVLYAVIFDMIVAPGHQLRGIGRQTLVMLLDRCARAGIRDVLLFSARGKAGFYRKFGFLPRPDDAPGMILRRTVPGS